MKPSITSSEPVIAQLSDQISSAGVELAFDYDDDEAWIVVLERPTARSENHITPHDLAGGEFLFIGIAAPRAAQSHLRYLLVDAHDPNPENPEVILVDSEEARLQFADRMLFSHFWDLVTVLPT
jgi:hypothetical protein